MNIQPYIRVVYAGKRKYGKKFQRRYTATIVVGDTPVHSKPLPRVHIRSIRTIVGLPLGLIGAREEGWPRIIWPWAKLEQEGGEIWLDLTKDSIEYRPIGLDRLKKFFPELKNRDLK